MAIKNFNFKVDFITKNSLCMAHVKQNDNATFNIYLTAQGQALDLTGQQVRLFVRKPDGKLVVQETNIAITDAKGGAIKVTVQNSIFQAVGVAVCEIDLWGTDKNNASSGSFLINIDEQLGSNDAVKSHVDVNLFRQLTEYIDEANADITKYKALVEGFVKAGVSLQGLVDIKAYIDNNLAELKSETDEAVSLIPQVNKARTDAEAKRVEVVNVTATAEAKRVAVVGATNSAEAKRLEVVTSTNTANASKNSLDTATANADVKKKEVETATATAEAKRVEVVGATNTANTSKSNLETATTNANTKKGEVITATADAEKKRVEVVNATATANNSKTALDTSITSGNKSKADLDASISSGNSLKAGLDASISSGNTLKAGLDSSISSGNSAKAGLETATTNAGTKKAEVETAIKNAESKRAEVVSSTSTADNSKRLLDGSITSGNSVKAGLDSSIASGNTLKAGLDASISSGNSTKSALDSATSSANTKKGEVITATANAEAKRVEVVGATNSAEAKRKELQGIIDSVGNADLVTTSAFEDKTGNTYTSMPCYNCENGVLVDTGIVAGSSTMVTVRITGNSYMGGTPPIECIYSFYDYTPTGDILALEGVAVGTALNLKVFRHEGKVKLWTKQVRSYQTLIFEITTSANLTKIKPSYSNQAMPTTGVTYCHEIVPTQVYSQRIKPTPADIGALGKTEKASDSSKLCGYGLNSGQGQLTSFIPFVGQDGVLEVGKYLDFHTKDSQDFAVRLSAEDGGLNILGRYKAINDLTYDSTKAPNNTSQIGIQSSNNGLGIGLSSEFNSRNGWIQVGHGDDSFSNVFGSLRLNPKGGTVYINNDIAVGGRGVNGYQGLCINGDDNNWIRTSSLGLIPYNSGSNSALGTDAWRFREAWIDTVYSQTLKASGNGKVLQLGTGGSDAYICNSKSNRYLQLKDDGRLCYNDSQVAYGNNEVPYDNGAGAMTEGRVHLGGNIWLFWGWFGINLPDASAVTRDYTIPACRRLHSVNVSCYSKDAEYTYGELGVLSIWSTGFKTRLYNARTGGQHYVSYQAIGTI